MKRIVFIGYGETDDFAHDGKYDEYVMAANRTDRFIKELWLGGGLDGRDWTWYSSAQARDNRLHRRWKKDAPDWMKCFANSRSWME